MKIKIGTLLILVSLVTVLCNSQTNCKYYRNLLSNLELNEISINKQFTNCDTISPFAVDLNLNNLFISGSIEYTTSEGFVRVILIDKLLNSFLLYESSSLTADSNYVLLDQSFYETGALQNTIPLRIEVIVQNAKLFIEKFSYIQFTSKAITEYAKLNDSLIQFYNHQIIDNINKKFYNNKNSWHAGETEISKLLFQDKLRFFKSAAFNSRGIEFYKGGIFVIEDTNSNDNVNNKSITVQKELSQSPKSVQLGNVIVDNFDWRNTHGKNWNSPVKSQGYCGSCWTFGSIAAVEGITNLYLNKIINLDLSEQQVISCASPSDNNCNGGDMDVALDYIKISGVVDELTYPYIEQTGICYNNFSPVERIKINDKFVFYGGNYSTETRMSEFKKAIMTRGIGVMTSEALNHVMAIVGFSIIYPYDVTYDIHNSVDFLYGSVSSNSDLVGKMCLIVKNSWGASWGYNGYGYFVCPFPYLGTVDFIELPITSLNFSENDIVIEDKDGDGYYNWGISVSKPVNCPLSFSDEDSDDSNPSIGPVHLDGTKLITGSYLLGFESRNDQFVQSTDDNFNWTFGSHSPNPNSGPQAAYEGSIYLYAGPQHFWDTLAIIIGPTIDLRNTCSSKVKFNYHMFGSHIGTLALQISINDGLTWSSNIWSRTGNQGNIWQNDSIDLTPYIGNIIKYRIIAHVIQSYTDQIAIDNMGVYFNTGTIGTQNIQSNQVWNDIRYLCNNIEIINNSIVSITGISVMQENSSITVKNGSTLNIDGGQLLKAKVIIESGGTLNIQNAGRITLMDPNFLIVNMGGICNVSYGEIYSK